MRDIPDHGRPPRDVIPYEPDPHASARLRAADGQPVTLTVHAVPDDTDGLPAGVIEHRLPGTLHVPREDRDDEP